MKKSFNELQELISQQDIYIDYDSEDFIFCTSPYSIMSNFRENKESVVFHSWGLDMWTFPENEVLGGKSTSLSCLMLLLFHTPNHKVKSIHAGIRGGIK